MQVNTANVSAVKADSGQNKSIRPSERAIGEKSATTKETNDFEAVEKLTNKKELDDGVNKLNETARIFNKTIHFSVHEASRRWMVQIINTETGEVINEIPPKKVLDMIASLDQLVGLLVDERR